MAKVDKLDRGELLKKRKRRKESDRVPMTVTYSNLLPDLNHIIRKHTKVLYKSERMTKVFQEPPMVAYRRDRNLRDSLVQGKTNKQVEKQVNHANWIATNVPAFPTVIKLLVQREKGSKSQITIIVDNTA